MKKLLIYLVPVALVAAQASGAPSSGWGEIGRTLDRAAGVGAENSSPLVLLQRRGGGGGARAGGGANVNRANVNRGSFNSGNFNATYPLIVTSRRTAM
jgi:hypothetical protein